MFFSRQQTAIDAKRAAVASAVHLLNEQAKVYQHLFVVIKEQLNEIDRSLTQNKETRSQVNAQSDAEQFAQLERELNELVDKRLVLETIQSCLVSCRSLLRWDKERLCSSENAFTILYLLPQDVFESIIFSEDDRARITALLNEKPFSLDDSTLALESFRLAQTEAERITNQAMNLSFALCMLSYVLMAVLGIALPILIIEVLMMFHIMLPLAVIALASALTQLCVVGASVAACIKQYDDDVKVLDQSIDVNDLNFTELNTFLAEVESYSRTERLRLGETHAEVNENQFGLV